MAFDLQKLMRNSSHYAVGDNDGQTPDVGSQWLYKSTADAIADINTAGYFDDAADRLKIGDTMQIVDSAGGVYDAIVLSNDGTTVDISDGVLLAATDTD